MIRDLFRLSWFDEMEDSVYFSNTSKSANL